MKKGGTPVKVYRPSRIALPQGTTQDIYRLKFSRL